jgi:hypothetical protein
LRTGCWERILGHQRQKGTHEDGKNYRVRYFIICTLHQVVLDWSDEGTR